MNTLRGGTPGATRVCPHCKATVLESAAICPGCKHHLRFSGTGHALEAGEGYCALSVDGTIAHTKASEPCEYCVVLDVRNNQGEQLTRQVVGVGVLQSGELRRLNVSVEMMPVRAAVPGKAAAAGLKPPGSGATATAAVASVAAKPAPPKSVAPAAAPARPGVTPAVGPQQPANQISSTAASASMQRLGIIRKPR